MATLIKTAAELIDEAASDIGALGPGESLSAEDFVKFDNKLDSLLEMLSMEGVYIADKDEVPAAFFLPMARLLGNVAGAAVVGAPLNDPAWDRDVHLLRRLSASRATYEPIKADYY